MTDTQQGDAGGAGQLLGVPDLQEAPGRAPSTGHPKVPAAGSPGGQLPSHPLLSLSADDVPPPPAPFAHRIVTLRSANVSSQFNLSSKEILGG